MSFFSEVAFLEYHMIYLNKNYSLCDLFDMFPAHPCFITPQKSMTVNLDNITFGPNERSLILSKSPEAMGRIIYYCLLYYIFEIDPQDEGTKIYQKLLNYILNNDLSLEYKGTVIENEQAKTYFIQFFYSLYRQRYKHKLIVEELSTIPQMDVLMLHLFRHITKVNEIKIQANGQEIEEAFKRQLGFTIELISNQVVVFQNQYLAEIKELGEEVQFSIRREKIDMHKLRAQYQLGKTAYFCHQNQSQLIQEVEEQERTLKHHVSTTSEANIITSKSIGLEEDPAKLFEKDQKDFLTEDAILGLRSFGSVPVSKQNLREKKKENQQSLCQEIEKLVNSSKLFKDSTNQVYPKPKTQQPQPKPYILPSIKNQKCVSLMERAQDKRMTVQERPSYRNSQRKQHKYTSTICFEQGAVFNLKKFELGEKVKCLKSERLKQGEVMVRHEKRVPSFIANRQKLKTEKKKQNVTEVAPSKQNIAGLKQPKITFSYGKH